MSSANSPTAQLERILNRDVALPKSPTSPKSTQKTLVDLLSSELITALNEYVPDKCPLITDAEREVWAKFGERRLVEKLNSLLAGKKK